MTEHSSAWKTLIDEWVARERRLHPDSPIKADSVRVRDAVEIDDQAFVLVSYDVDYPWPQEEDAPGEARSQNTAVLQALRVRQPWIERDAARSFAQLSTGDGEVVVYEHPLGPRRAFSGSAASGPDRAELTFEDSSTTEVSVVDGWFLAVVPESRRLASLRLFTGDTESYSGDLRADDLSAMFDETTFARSAGHTMYFSPLDVRRVLPVVQWERVGNVVVVAVSIEQYDEGGILRLRIDGVRVDDDVFINWPHVRLQAEGADVASAICGEYSLADTLSLDIGFRPWISDSVEQLAVTVSGLRGAEGPIGPVSLDLRLPNRSQQG